MRSDVFCIEILIPLDYIHLQFQIVAYLLFNLGLDVGQSSENEAPRRWFHEAGAGMGWGFRVQLSDARRQSNRDTASAALV